MSENSPQYGLPPRGEFSREQLDEDLTGKIACIRGASAGFSVTGKVLHLKIGDIAVLRPYITFKNNKPISMDRRSIIADPTVISEYDCETLQETIEQYGPTLENPQKKDKPKRKKK